MRNPSPGPSALSRLQVAILGASGYIGADLIRLLRAHPFVEILALAGDAKAGQSLETVYPHLGFDRQMPSRGATARRPLPDLQRIEEIDFDHIDLVFGCLPHGASESQLGPLAARLPIIDHSADFRFSDPSLYAATYQRSHEHPALLPDAVYGLTEFARPQLRARPNIVACPGCYPTATLLALLPALASGMIEADDLIIDAKSGVSGAGRGLKEANLFCEIGESTHPYSIGNHRHAPEIEQILSRFARKPVMVNFTPHLVPMSRGELCTIYAKLAKGVDWRDVRQCLIAHYAQEPFVHIADEGMTPATRHVRGSNHCAINVFADRLPGRVILVSVIDNLVKGSAGQAIQNLNVMMDWPESTALEQAPLFP